jgi:hypothetical protein
MTTTMEHANKMNMLSKVKMDERLEKATDYQAWEGALTYKLAPFKGSRQLLTTKDISDQLKAYAATETDELALLYGAEATEEPDHKEKGPAEEHKKTERLRLLGDFDATLKNVLLDAVSSDIQRQIVGFQTSYEVWQYLKETYEHTDEASIEKLERQIDKLTYYTGDFDKHVNKLKFFFLAT